jgi:hypothetical protein
MTVEQVGLLTHFTDNVQRAYCRWFMKDEPKEGAFPVHMLKLVEDDDGPLEEIRG